MVRRILKLILSILLLSASTLLPVAVFAQRPTSGSLSGAPVGEMAPGFIPSADLDIYVKGPEGTPISSIAVVTLVTMTGRVYRQGALKAGYVRLNDVAESQYRIQVVAPGFERVVKEVDTHGSGTNKITKVTIELQRAADAEEAQSAAGFAALPPKAHKDMGKALEALRADKSADARNHLEALYRIAPTNAEVVYLFGVYSSQRGDRVQAKSYWTKTLELNPKHLGALLSLSDILLREKRADEAMPYLNRAVEAEPSSWRGHALLTEAFMLKNAPEEAAQHAERALELGHGQASAVQPLLARALADRGDKEQAIRVLQTYLQGHSTDVAAKKQLEGLLNPPLLTTSGDALASRTEATESALNVAASSLPLPSSWLPPDVDEKVPPVEQGAACALDEVVQKTQKKIQEFLGNVDRFTATESLFHESINKWGFASSTEKRKFNYVVAIEQMKQGLLNVEEYRSSGNASAEFPDGVATNGLPALVLIFHPKYVDSFELSCEGLARWNGGLAWQVHFRQRTDRPNMIRKYRLGFDGPSYPIALKGRAWIAADSYQIVRLEADLVSPVPQIRLAADHIAIEYGPVHFSKGNVDMWLPQSAEVYYDWKGRRIHRRHSFSNYLLFSVDDKQRISVPKVEDAPPASPSDEGTRPDS